LSIVVLSWRDVGTLSSTMLTYRPTAGMESSVRSPDDYIFLTNGAKYWVGPVGEIVILETDGNYTAISVSSGQTLMVRGVLYKWEASLPPSLFFRVSRDCIINLKHVIEMRMHDAKRFSFIIPGNREVIMSRLQTLEFRKAKCL
jgi:two-component system, LytTR family, response regulator